MDGSNDEENDGKLSFGQLPQASSGSARTSTSSLTAPIQDNTQLLRLETITDAESRRIMSFLKATVLLALIGAIIVAAIKESSRGVELIVLNRNFVIVQVVIFGILLGSLVIMFAVWGLKIAMSFRNEMVWSTRRLRAVQGAILRGVAAGMVVSGQFASNVKLLTDPSVYCYSTKFMPATGFIIFTGFNCILLLLVIDAHGTNFVRGDESNPKVVRDAPWTSHWPKVLFMWLPLLGLVGWTMAMYAEDGHSVEVQPVGDTCGWGAEVKCSTSGAFDIAGSLSVCVIIAYFALYGFYLWRAWRQLASKLYQKYRMMNIVLRIQLRVNAAMVATLLVSMGLTWYLGGNTCVNYAVTWFGVPSVGLMVVSIQALAFYFTYPRDREAIGRHGATPAYLLQQFAWTEADVPRKHAARATATAGNAALHTRVASAPLFCFETAIKLFFWAVMSYSYKEADPADIRAMPDAIRSLVVDMESAMRLYRLAKRCMFYDPELGTKVLVTWNAELILVVVRGSAEAANFLEDAKFLQTAHPPVRKFRGRRPNVHQGFLATWHANDIHRRVLAHIAALLDSAEDRGAVRVLCTGHSLGGAVAQLASFDIVRELGVEPHNVQVYTYGCPRLGNHALAEEFAQVVPHTWHIINDNDVVTRGMKLLGMYKRAGQRVIVNDVGHLIVRPNHLEASLLQRIRGGTGKHHLTVEYQRSLMAVISAQLRASSRHDDGLHGLLGLLKGVPQVRMAMEAHAESIGTSLVDLVRDLGTQGAATLHTHHAAVASTRFSIRQHMSLVRAAGGSAADVAVVSGHGVTPGSPASGASGDVPPVFVEAVVAGDAEAALAADTLGVADAELLQEAATGAAVANVRRWRNAAAVARLAARYARGATTADPHTGLDDSVDPSGGRRDSALDASLSGDAPDACVTCAVAPRSGGDAGKPPERGVSLAPRGNGGPAVQGGVLQLGAAPSMRGLRGRATMAEVNRIGEDARPQHAAADSYDTTQSHTIELVDAAAQVDVEVAAVDSQGVAESAYGAERRDDSVSYSSSSGCGLVDGSVQVLHEVKQEQLGKTDSVGQGVSPITNSEGGSTLSATGGGLSLSPVAPMGGQVIVEESAGRDGGAGEPAADGSGGDDGGVYGVYARSIDNQLFLSDTARSSFLQPRGEGVPPKREQSPQSPPAKGKGIGRRSSAGQGQVRLVDTDAIVLQMEGSQDGRRGSGSAGVGGPPSFGSVGRATTASSCHQELSLMDADPLSNNHSLAGCLPPRPPSGSAAVGGLPTAPAYLLGRSPGRDGMEVRGLPCPLSIGRASDDDSMHLTTASAWSYGEGGGAGASDGGDDDGAGPQWVGGVGPNGLPVLGWNQIPNQEPERIRGAMRPPAQLRR